MFNNSKDIQILLEGEALYSGIIRAISLARNAIERYLGVSYIDPENVTSGAKNILRLATIHKFLHDYKSEKNKQIFNEEWIKNIFNIQENGIQSNADIYCFCTAYGQSVKLTNQYKGSLKSDVNLLLHCLWVEKVVLLPLQSKLPLAHNKESGGNNYEIASFTYPETLRICRDTDSNYSVVEYIGLKGKDNFLWTSYRLIRASSWYEIKDINDDDLKIAANHCRNTITYPFPLKSWMTGILNAHPDASFDISSIQVGKSGSSGGDHDFYKNDPSFSKLEKQALSEWIKYRDDYIKALKTKGLKSWNQNKKEISFIIGWIINEVHKKSPKKTPDIKNFKREHLLGNNYFEGLYSYVKTNRSLESYKNTLYKIEGFFDYLQNSCDLDFKNPINRSLDFPIVKRRRGTVKKILPSEAFAPLLSFGYALSDFAYYVFEKVKRGDSLGYNNNMDVIDTEGIGFIPIVWINGKPIYIRYIPFSLIPTSVRQFSKFKKSSIVPDIHSINLITLIHETGIRLIHARWLDYRNYRSLVNQSFYKPRDHGINYLHINTDKSHGPWTCHCSNTVIEILDRQAEYRASFNEDSLNKILYYDHHHNSPFDMILPLFSVGGIARGNQDLSSPISDSTFRAKYKLFIYTFNFYYASETNENLLDLPFELSQSNHDDMLDFFKEVLTLYDPKFIDTTPHSARSQVVSRYIPLLPPSVIMKITGHVTEEHLVYYTQLDKVNTEKMKERQFQDIVEELNDPLEIKASSENSKLRSSFLKNRDKTLKDFGAVSLGSTQPKSKEDPINLVKSISIENISFNTTHICPFGNQCPMDVIQEFEASIHTKPCGACFYSVKTIDHIPAILAKIRSFTSESNDLKLCIEEAKKNGADRDSLSSYANRRKFLSDEIIAWSLTYNILEKMAVSLSNKNFWLVEKPELLSSTIKKMKIKDENLESIYIKASEAKSYSEFFTPTLKYQIKSARSLLLAKTGDFNSLLEKTTDNYNMIDIFRGQVKLLCTTFNVSLQDLAKAMDRQLVLTDSSISPLNLISSTGNK